MKQDLLGVIAQKKAKRDKLVRQLHRADIELQDAWFTLMAGVDPPKIEPTKRRPPDPDGMAAGDVFDTWNSIAAAHGLVMVEAPTAERMQKVRARLNAFPKKEQWRRVFDEIQDSGFLRGHNERGWKITFDFLIRSDETVAKVLEGNYGPRGRANRGTSQL